MISESIPLFKKVLFKDECVWGGWIENSPDLFLMWNEHSALKERNYVLMDGSRLDPPGIKGGSALTWCGTHRMEGLFGIFGDGVKVNSRIENPVNLADVMPTIHMISGLEIPSDVDGRPVISAFEDEYISSHPPIFGPPEDFDPSGKGQGISEEDSGKLLDLLQGLGYLN